MPRHAPTDYRCPFCALVQGIECPGLHSAPQDIVCRDERAMAFVASHWCEKNPGHVLVVPVRHYENLYELPDEDGAAIFAMSRRIAIAMKRGYACEGVSTRQHNEPAGYQEVWHYHQHVFPRYADDQLYLRYGKMRLTGAAERWPYADKLKTVLAEMGTL
jgi:histidine triad (HIT) family protein